jgi:predicted nuclease of restriction endonuclease-like (RecB) superfamily
MPCDAEVAPEGYQALLGDLKERIRSAQIKAAVTVSRELVALYWQIGREIVERQQAHGWGTQVIDRLATDLRQSFPGMKGFSRRNLHYMRALAAAYPERAAMEEAVAGLPWGHTMRLLDMVADPAARGWYARTAVQHGWSRAILAHQVESDLYGRQGRAPTNFARTLPPAQSDLAREVLKDPYNFDVRRSTAYRIPF